MVESVIGNDDSSASENTESPIRELDAVNRVRHIHYLCTTKRKDNCIQLLEEYAKLRPAIQEDTIYHDATLSRKVKKLDSLLANHEIRLIMKTLIEPGQSSEIMENLVADYGILKENLTGDDPQLVKILNDLDDLYAMIPGGDNKCRTDWLELRQRILAKYEPLAHMHNFVLNVSAKTITDCFEKSSQYLQSISDSKTEIDAAIVRMRLMKFGLQNAVHPSYLFPREISDNIGKDVLAKGVVRYLENNFVQLDKQLESPLEQFLESIDSHFDKLVIRYCHIIESHFAHDIDYYEKIRKTDVTNWLKASENIHEWMDNINICWKLRNVRGRDWYLIGKLNYQKILKELVFDQALSREAAVNLIDILLSIGEARSRLLDHHIGELKLYSNIRELLVISAEKCDSPTFKRFDDLMRDSISMLGLNNILKASKKSQIHGCLALFKSQHEPRLNQIEPKHREALERLRNITKEMMLGSQKDNKILQYMITKNKTLPTGLIDKILKDTVRTDMMAVIKQEDFGDLEVKVEEFRRENIKNHSAKACVTLHDMKPEFEQIMELISMYQSWLVELDEFTINFIFDYNICNNHPIKLEASTSGNTTEPIQLD